MADAPVFVAAGDPAVGDPVLDEPADVAWPDHQENDIGLLLVETDGTTVDFLKGTDFIEVPVSPKGDSDPPGSQLQLYWARAGASPMGNVLAYAPGGDHVIGQILTFRGCKTSGDPWNAIDGDTSNASTSGGAPGITTTVDNCLTVLMCSTGADSALPQFGAWTSPDLTGLTTLTEIFTNFNNGGGFTAAAGLKALAGAVAPSTVSLAIASSQGRFTIALEGAENVVGPPSVDDLNPLDKTRFEKAMLRMIDPPLTIQSACYQLSRQYEDWARVGVVPTPVLTDNRQRMERILIQAFNPKFGTPDKAISGIVQAFTAFWLGTPIPGGVVTAFLGGPALAANLTSRFTNPRATLQQIAFHLSASFVQATAMVQYLIPPGPPLFLITLPTRPWS